MSTGVYLVKCIANGRCYVGSSKNIPMRWKEHRYDLRHNQHCNDHWQKAWNKYGENKFEWSVLEATDVDDTVLRQREQHWIDILHPEFNVSRFVFHTRLGLPHNEQSKKKMSDVLCRKWRNYSEDERIDRIGKIRAAARARASKYWENNPNLIESRKAEQDKKKSRIEQLKQEQVAAKEQRRLERESTKEERRVAWRMKLRAIALEQWADPAYRAKHSEATRKAMQDPEVLKRLSDSHKGRALSEEHKRRIGDSQRGTKRPPETGRKISAAKMGHSVSEETRRKISETKKRNKLLRINNFCD